MSKPWDAPLGFSGWALILSNFVPIIGTLAWGWNVFDVVALYWMENVILGCLNVLRMIGCMGKIASKAFLIPFFIVHYGGFCAGHGVFVFLVFAKNSAAEHSSSHFHPSPSVGSQVGEFLADPWTLVAAAGLFVSHLISFFSNYIGKEEFRRVGIDELMSAPYARIMVLHFAIVLGGVPTMLLGSPVGLLLVLIVGKTALDLKLHRREHAKLQELPAVPRSGFEASGLEIEINAEEGSPEAPTRASRGRRRDGRGGSRRRPPGNRG